MNRKDIERYINDHFNRKLPVFQNINIPFFYRKFYLLIKDSFYDICNILIEENAELKKSIQIKAEELDRLGENVQNINEENKYLRIKAEELDRLGENVQNINEENKYLRIKAEELDRLGENVQNINEENKYLRIKAEELDRLGENVQNINEENKYLRIKAEELDRLGENVQNINEENKYLRIKAEELDRLGENVQNINEENKYLRIKAEELDRLGENVQNINEENKYLRIKAKELDNLAEILKKMNTELEYLNFKVKNYRKNAAADSVKSAEGINKTEVNQKSLPTEKKYEAIDYFDFENHFRGSIEEIKERQKIYIKYFKGKRNVVDLGCGRGEFLHLLKENHITAVGVDLYETYADFCNSTGVKAVCRDAIEYMKGIASTDGVFAGQLVEHLRIEQIVALSEIVFEKLEDEGYFVIETPNPMSLAIYTNSFYLDPSHIKPVHPFTMKYILEKSGFRNVEIIFTESSRDTYKIPRLTGKEIEGLEEFNYVMNAVSDRLFGSQDYAIIAQKRG